MFNLK